MEWDKFRMAQKFLQRANAIHPEDMNDGASHVEALARQDVYYDCYMSSFSLEELLKRLADVLAGKIELPDEEDIDESHYKATYISEARRILKSLEQGEVN